LKQRGINLPLTIDDAIQLNTKIADNFA